LKEKSFNPVVVTTLKETNSSGMLPTVGSAQWLTIKGLQNYAQDVLPKISPNADQLECDVQGNRC
jgi:hypothetical protein